MAPDKNQAPKSAAVRRTLLLFLLAGAIVALLDHRRIFTGGDLVTAGTLLRISLIATAAAGLGGGLVALLILVLPRELTRFLSSLLRLVIPNRLAESLLAALVVCLLVLPYPLQRFYEQHRLAAELAEAETGTAGGSGDAGKAAAGRTPPNVIVLVLDTVRADHLSVYGYGRETTPNLERRAEDFLVFEGALSSAPWTVPAHATLFTGRHAFQHGAHGFLPREINFNKINNNVFRMNDGLETLASILRANGYATGAEVSNIYLAPALGFDRGFDSYRYHMNGNYRLELRTGALLERLMPEFWRAVFDQPQQTARQLNRRIFQWLEQRAEPPFFLFANYMDAHRPYHPPPPFSTAFPGRLDGFAYNIPFEEAIMGRTRDVRPEERAHMHSRYDGAIRYLDAQLERLFRRLEEMGLYGDSLILVTSDHGEYFGEHQLLEHSKDVYRQALEVPLMIKFPGGEPRGRTVTRAHYTDILPTLLSLLAIEPPAGLPGRNVLGPAPPTPLLSELYFSRIKDLRRCYGGRFMRIRRALFHGDWKFIHSSDGRHELYDLSTDREEAHNLVDERPELAAELLAMYERIMAEAAESGTGSTEADDAMEMDEETVERLKALGYL